jgi:hypothetical protein
MDFILWELPYATGLGLIHSAAIRKGVAMELVSCPEKPDESEGLREAFAAMRERYKNDRAQAPATQTEKN